MGIGAGDGAQQVGEKKPEGGGQKEFQDVKDHFLGGLGLHRQN